MLRVLLGTNIHDVVTDSKRKVMFSQACVILFIIGLMATHSLLVLFTVRSVCILLEWFLVFRFFLFREVHCLVITVLRLRVQCIITVNSLDSGHVVPGKKLVLTWSF